MFALKAEHCMGPGANDRWFLSPNLVQDKKNIQTSDEKGNWLLRHSLELLNSRAINAIISRDSRVLTSIKCASTAATLSNKT